MIFKYFKRSKFILLPLILAVILIVKNALYASSSQQVKQPKSLSNHRYDQFKEKIQRPKYDINCRSLFELNKREQIKADTMLNKLHKTNQTSLLLPDANFIFDKSMCKMFKILRGYDQYGSTPEEVKFPLAYLILVYEEVEQFERLLRLIYRSQNIYCIHVDSSASTQFKLAIRSIIDCFDNVFMATRSWRVVWGSINLLNADLTCMHDLLNLNSLINRHPNLIGKRVVAWKYVLNLASTMLPLRTNYELVRILDMYKGTNDMEIIKDKESSGFRYKNKWSFNHNSDQPFQVPNSIKTPPPGNLTIVKCANYAALSRDFVNFTINSQIGRELIAWLNDTFVPDEMLWCTLEYNMKSRFGFKDIKSRNYMRTMSLFIKWGHGELKDECYSYWRHDICILSFQDLPILAQKPQLFANKFILSYDPITYQCMEEWYDTRSTLMKNHLYYFDLKTYCDFISPRSTLAKCGLNFTPIPHY